MSRLVVDASAALAWLLPAQATQTATAFIAELRSYELCAPAVFEWEVLNALNLHRWRGLGEAWHEGALATLAATRIEVAAPERPQRLQDLAAAEQLSLFEAAYLDMAGERSAAIASRDRGLIAAGRRCGVTVHDLRDVPAHER